MFCFFFQIISLLAQGKSMLFQAILTFGGVAPAVALRVVRECEQVYTRSSSTGSKNGDT